MLMYGFSSPGWRRLYAPVYCRLFCTTRSTDGPILFQNDYLPPPGERISKLHDNRQQQQQQQRRQLVEARAAAVVKTDNSSRAAAAVRKSTRSTRSSRSSHSCSSRENSISHDACRSPSSREEAQYVREHAHSRSKNRTTIIDSSSGQAQQQ